MYTSNFSNGSRVKEESQMPRKQLSPTRRARSGLDLMEARPYSLRVTDTRYRQYLRIIGQAFVGIANII